MQQRSADILVDTLRSEARAPSGYGTNLLYVYLLLAADGVLNALADTGTAPATQLQTVLILALQIVLRVLTFFALVGVGATTGRWREGQLDILLLDYRAVIATHLLSLVVCLFLRMYGVMMSAYPADFPDVRSYWRSGVYPAMLLCHTAASLVFYATTVSSVHQLGEGGVDVGYGEGIDFRIFTFRDLGEGLYRNAIFPVLLQEFPEFGLQDSI